MVNLKSFPLAFSNSTSNFLIFLSFSAEREPPSVEIFPKEPQKLKVGESTRFSCRASGTPYPQITWTRRDGKPLSSRITEDYPGVITLRDATIEDAGSYECKATNIAGTTTQSASIEMQQSPTIYLTPDTQSIEITEGDELRFSCHATGIPEPSIEIKVPENSNIRVVTPLGRSGRPEASVHHTGIQRHQEGLYSCVAVNEAGQDLRYIQVNVKEKRGDVGKFSKSIKNCKETYCWI